MTVTFEWEKVTPAKAQEYLDTMKSLNNDEGNRRRKTAKRRKFLRAYQNGTFNSENGDGLRFDVTGAMFDGQHRCLAIIDYGKPVKLLVIRGLSASSFATVDQGGREAHDALYVAGYKYDERNLSGVARAWMNFEFLTLDDLTARKQSGKDELKWAPDEVLQFVESTPELVAAAIEAKQLNNKMGFGSSAVLSLVIKEGRRVNAEQFNDFLKQVIDGEGLYRGDPAYAYRNALAGAGSAKNIRSDRDRVRVNTALLIKAFDAYLNARPATLLRWNVESEKFPEFSQPRKTAAKQ